MQNTFSEEIGKKPTLEWINVDEIDIDRNYQRDVHPALVKKIALNFNWANFQAPTLVKRPNGKYMVVDGQHRVAAAALHPQITQIPVLVQETDGEIEQEAKSFVAINTNRRNINQIEKYHAALTAKDADALLMKQVVESVGCKIVDYHGQTSPRATSAVVRLSTIIKKFGEQAAKNMLTCITDAFPNHNAPLAANLMFAVASLMAANPKKLDVMHLSSSLKKLGFDEIATHAKAHVKLGGGTQEALRYVICSVYNRGIGKTNQIRG